MPAAFPPEFPMHPLIGLVTVATVLLLAAMSIVAGARTP